MDRYFNDLSPITKYISVNFKNIKLIYTLKKLKVTYDYIIIGAGSAGCLIAKSLSKNLLKVILKGFLKSKQCINKNTT